jgi:hypothetical protein
MSSPPPWLTDPSAPLLALLTFSILAAHLAGFVLVVRLILRLLDNAIVDQLDEPDDGRGDDDPTTVDPWLPGGPGHSRPMRPRSTTPERRYPVSRRPGSARRDHVRVR